MLGGKLTQIEREIIHHLLLDRGIAEYEIIDVTNEGQELPGSIHDDEIELLSGVFATPTKAYMFWLGWQDGHYTSGEKTGFWKELSPSEWGLYNKQIIAAQRRLKEKALSAS